MKRIAYLVLLLPIVLISLITKKNVSVSNEVSNLGRDNFYADRVYADTAPTNANCVGSACASCEGGPS
jgi:hypothetical protein